MGKFKIIGKIDLSAFEKPVQISPSFTTTEEQEAYEENYRIEYEMDMYLDYELNYESYEDMYDEDLTEFNWEAFEKSLYHKQ